MYFYTYFENFPNIKKLKNSEFKMIPKSLLKKLKLTIQNTGKINLYYFSKKIILKNLSN